MPRTSSASKCVAVCALAIGVAPAAAQFLQSTSSISGRVINRHSEIVPAKVIVYERRVQNGRVDLIPQCASDTDQYGVYRCDNLPPGNFTVEASALPSLAKKEEDSVKTGSAKSFAPKQTPPRPTAALVYPPTFYPDTATLSLASVISVRAGQSEQVNIVMQPFVGQTLRFVLPGPFPVAGVRILSSGGSNSPLTCSIVSEEHSRNFHIDAVPPGSYRVEADWYEGDGIHHAVEPVTVGLRAARVIQLKETRDSPLTGKLVFPDELRLPLPSSIELEKVSDESGWSLIAPVGADGVFEFPALREGRYLLHIPASDGVFVRTIVQEGSERQLEQPIRAEGDGRPIQLRLVLGVAALAIRGKVAQTSRKDAVRAGVTLHASNGHITTTLIDEKGNYVFDHIPPDRYELFAWSNLGAVAYREENFLHGYRDHSSKVHLDGTDSAASTDLTLINVDK